VTTLVTELLTVDVLPSDRFDLEIGGGVSFLGVDFDVRQSDGPEVSASQFTVAPTAAARAEACEGPFALTAIGSYGAAETAGVRSRALDVDVSASYRLLERWGFSGAFTLGYRIVGFDLSFRTHASDFDADLSLRGPFLGLVLANVPR
jgi:hypothetical protein